MSLSSIKFTNINLLPLDSEPSTPQNGDIYFNAGDQNIHIYRSGNWAVVTATGSVYMKYTNTAGTTITSTTTTVPFANEVLNSHPGSMNTSTGVYTIPEDGVYLVFGQLQVVNSNINTSSSMSARILHNGGSINTNLEMGNGGTGQAPCANPMAIIVASTGDTIELQGAIGGTSPSLNTNADRNYFSCVKIGSV